MLSGAARAHLDDEQLVLLGELADLGAQFAHDALVLRRRPAHHLEVLRQLLDAQLERRRALRTSTVL